MPTSSRGNAKFVQVQHFYADPALRKFAPPIILFEQVEHDRNRRGYDPRLMRSYPVSTRINHVANDDEDCSRPAEIAEGLLAVGLFDVLRSGGAEKCDPFAVRRPHRLCGAFG